MNRQNSPIRPFFTLLCFSVVFVGINGHSCPGRKNERAVAKLREEFENYKKQTVLNVRNIFDKQEPCSTRREKRAIARLQREEDKLEGLLKVIQGATIEGLQARVPRPQVLGQLGASLNFSCQLPTPQTLRLCLWERNLGSEDQMVIVDKQFQNGEETSIAGVTYSGDDGLRKGKCGLRINSVSMVDLDRSWNCMLVTKNGTLFTGQVIVESVPDIYFATYEGRIKAYSLANSRVRTVVDRKESTRGIAYDSVGNRIYWSTFWSYKIQRATMDGLDVETVLSTRQYGYIQCLASDWITGNIYVGTQTGYIIACNTTGTLFVCSQVLTGQGNIQGITLNPIQGNMYWTRFSSWSRSSIATAGMDGTSPRTIVTGLTEPCGIVVDFSVSRLYWADWEAGKIQSSDLNGRDVRTLFPASQPYGIVVVGERIIWANKGNRELWSRSGREFKNASRLHTDNHYIRHLAVVPNFGLPNSRENHCDGQNCTRVCVLSALSFRCLN